MRPWPIAVSALSRPRPCSGGWDCKSRSVRPRSAGRTLDFPNCVVGSLASVVPWIVRPAPPSQCMGNSRLTRGSCRRRAGRDHTLTQILCSVRALSAEVVRLTAPKLAQWRASWTQSTLPTRRLEMSPWRCRLNCRPRSGRSPSTTASASQTMSDGRHSYRHCPDNYSLYSTSSCPTEFSEIRYPCEYTV